MHDGARRAVAYIRSAETRADAAERSSESPSVQRRAIESWAAREGVAVEAWEVDLGVEGAAPIAERPGLLAAYAAIQNHRAGRLIAANAERFSHDELVCWLIERAALASGAVLCTADGSEPKTRSPATRASREDDAAYTRGALDLARAYQRVTLGARIRTVLAEKKARGERIGNLPYGFRLARDGHHTEPDAAEQAVIASVHELSREGLSQRAIAGQLASRGIVGRTGSPLGQTQIAKILRATG